MPTSTPYLEPLSSTTVRMIDPNSSDSQFRYRTSTISPSSVYTFSHVFPSTSSQSDFFTKSTLPLIKDVLSGQNALLFAYGVTNSGKTYTIQGGPGKGKKQGSAGILPRTLDVIFNSIESLQGDGRVIHYHFHVLSSHQTNSSALCVFTASKRPVHPLHLFQTFQFLSLRANLLLHKSSQTT